MSGSESNRKNGGRDGKGRFAKGNPGGPGNPNLAHISSLRAAVREAVGPEAIADVLRMLLGLARDGDVQAAKELLDRALGKPAAAADEAPSIDLGPLKDATDIAAATSRVALAIGEGRLSADHGTRIAAVLELARKAHELGDVEERLSKLERAQEAVRKDGGRNGQ